MGMGFWDMVIIAIFAGSIIALVAIIGDILKRRGVSKRELIEISDTLSTMQKDIDEMKTNIANMVIQLDDIKLS